MRLLFVSNSYVGGSGRSQRELAARLLSRGHQVLILVDPNTPCRWTRWWHEQLTDAAVRGRRWPGGRLLESFAKLPGRHGRIESFDGIAHVTSPIPENAFRSVFESFGPDVVVGSSISRPGWRRIRAIATAAATPTVLYVREDTSMGHFVDGNAPADAIIANAESLANHVRRLGFECAFIPSVIDVMVTAVESSRTTALAINPTTDRGVDTVLAVAARIPNVPFVLRESWPLEPAELTWLLQRLASLPNAEFRHAAPPGPEVYADARVLLVPYRVDNRPRVILEAQSNGIPVVVGDVPALIEATGPGGVVVPLDDIDAWVNAIRRLWEDTDLYDRLSEAAQTHSGRPEVTPDGVAAAFEEFVQSVLSASPGARSPDG